MLNKIKKTFILRLFCIISIFFISFFLIILLPCLIIFNLFSTSLNTGVVDENFEFAGKYKEVLNKYMKDGYVPLSRILYFYREDEGLSFDKLYLLNQDSTIKNVRDIEQVCLEADVKNLVACTQVSINENENALVLNQSFFNFPLDDNYIITSFQNEERVVFGERNRHGGWDFATSPQTPVYSVCDGIVSSVNYTQQENIPYTDGGNKIGNSIRIKCDIDSETYTIIYHHLYPNSAKVKVGDLVNHYTLLASVGTTGWSTGNHLHWEVHDKNGKSIDGMLLVNLTILRSEYSD